MALSNHMNAQLDGKMQQDGDNESKVSEEQKEDALAESQFNNN